MLSAKYKSCKKTRRALTENVNTARDNNFHNDFTLSIVMLKSMVLSWFFIRKMKCIFILYGFIYDFLSNLP